MGRASGSNSGIVISGGQVTVTQAVAGTDARAHYHCGSPAAPPPGHRANADELADLRQRLEELSAALARHPGTMQPHQAEALTAARAEAAKGKPDGQRIKSLMSVVAEGAKSIASVAGAVQAVTALIAAF